MPRPVHFEIHAGAPDRAVKFYTTVFGWKFERWGEEPYWVISTGEGNGIDGGLLPRVGPAPAASTPVCGYVNTIAVTDLDGALASVSDAGGSLTLPKNSVPGVGWLAYCTDTEGNIFGLLQPDSDAAPE
ncbi:VOC family protein [Amycolatopsis nalaikhensis]|uniref:VOC family protein n=1 Tax=Amycolatopsis nalaikhensis TaxID=715472 RepID=A0ABY8XDE4_9PSEU|nr:VOC family protein [Amycolatopsis sp. 2-2]WIV53535.1 VOC family protein [Amycolatopsis sp. 2-2]